MSTYHIHDTKRKLVVFTPSEEEYWIDSITEKVEKDGKVQQVVRIRAQNVRTNELTDWQEYVGEIDPMHQFIKQLKEKNA